MEYPKPIVKFNNGRGAIICNKCRVIIIENLTKEEYERPHLIFCEKHYGKYLEKTQEPAWICLECAAERGASPPQGHCYTTHTDICGICNKEKEVTEPRDMGVQRSLVRIKKVI